MQTGDYVVYSGGPTAIARLGNPHAGGFHADYCLGGTVFVSRGYPNHARLAVLPQVLLAEDSKNYVLPKVNRSLFQHLLITGDYFDDLHGTFWQTAVVRDGIIIMPDQDKDDDKHPASEQEPEQEPESKPEVEEFYVTGAIELNGKGLIALAAISFILGCVVGYLIK